MENEKANVMLFLGSGVSYAAGMPSVDEITNGILEGQSNLDSYNDFRTCKDGRQQNYNDLPLQKLLNEFSEYLEQYPEEEI